MFLPRLLYWGLVVLCVAISLYLTYFGFERTFQELTLAFTAVIGIVLFGADFLIQRSRERGDPLKGAFLLFFVAAFFSGASNFNYLYTNFMTSDVLASTLRTQYKTFRDDLAETDRKLSNISSVEKENARRVEIDKLLIEVWEQMTDPGRPGCRTRCRDLMNEIRGIIGTGITDLHTPGSSANDSEFKSFYETYRNLVNVALDSTSSNTPYLEVTALKAKIENKLEYYDAADRAIRGGTGLSVLSELSQESQDIERDANKILETAQVEKKAVHTYIDPDLGRLGEIVYSLKNGFIEMPNTVVTVMALILSLLVDFIPILFALVAFRPGDSSIPEPKSDDWDILND